MHSVREKVLRELSALREKHDAEVRTLIGRAAQSGIRSEDIAQALGISRATLWRHYRSNLSGYRGPSGSPTPPTSSARS